MATLLADGTYIHVQKFNDPNLTYTVEDTTDLLLGFSPASVTVLGTNLNGRAPTYNIITNSVTTTDDEKFIRLKVDLVE